MSRGYTSVGQMAPFYVFPCGHAFHVHCLIAHVTCSVNETQVSCKLMCSISHIVFLVKSCCCKFENQDDILLGRCNLKVKVTSNLIK
jgi:hypothetical protein